MKTKTILIIFLFFLLIKNISAIGIGPVFTNINFEPNLTASYSFRIYNTDKKDFTTSINIIGELTDYMTLEKNIIELKSGENSKEVRFNLKLPRDFPPGTHSVKISVGEASKELEGGGGAIGAVLGVSHKVSLTVPKHGKYIKEDIKIEGKNLIVLIKNIGIKNISSLNGTITFFYNKEEVLTITINPKSLISDEILNLTQEIGLSQGIYQGKIILNYDEVRKETRKTFIIGEKTITIKEIRINDFKPGEIGQIDLLLESNWNREIRDVFADIGVFKDNRKVQTFKTASININKTTIIRGFWDTKGLTLGKYNIQAIVNYEGITAEKIITVNLEKEKAEIKEKKVSTGEIVLTIALFIIIIINIWFYFKKKKQEKKNKAKK